MQNVIQFPIVKKKSLVDSIRERFEIRAKKKKMLKKIAYDQKKAFLLDKTYNSYLKQWLENYDNTQVDIPKFMYERKMVVSDECLKLAKMSVQQVEDKYGTKEIEKCYKKALKTK